MLRRGAGGPPTLFRVGVGVEKGRRRAVAAATTVDFAPTRMAAVAGTSSRKLQRGGGREYTRLQAIMSSPLIKARTARVPLTEPRARAARTVTHRNLPGCGVTSDGVDGHNSNIDAGKGTACVMGWGPFSGEGYISAGKDMALCHAFQATGSYRVLTSMTSSQLLRASVE